MKLFISFVVLIASVRSFVKNMTKVVILLLLLLAQLGKLALMIIGKFLMAIKQIIKYVLIGGISVASSFSK